jgi:hypothetical protein
VGLATSKTGFAKSFNFPSNINLRTRTKICNQNPINPVKQATLIKFETVIPWRNGNGLN